MSLSENKNEQFQFTWCEKPITKARILRLKPFAHFKYFSFYFWTLLKHNELGGKILKNVFDIAINSTRLLYSVDLFLSTLHRCHRLKSNEMTTTKSDMLIAT